MKKTLTFMLAFILCLGLFSCANNDNDDYSRYDSNELEEEEEKGLTFTDAQNQVRDSITGGLLYFRLLPYSADSIGNINISSMSGDSIEGGWIIECSGTFTSYDKYGDIMDRYRFDVSQKVYTDGTTDYADVNVSKK